MPNMERKGHILDTETTPGRLDVTKLAHELDCFTEADLCQLAKITPGTAEAWRKRGTGPEYTRIGNTVLYPRKPLAEFLHSRVRRGGFVRPKDLL